MADYLRRLATTGFAYTGASVLSKLIAVALLPLYTSYVDPDQYGIAEILFVAVVALSIVVRLGVIEALLRFYYLPGEKPERVVSTGFAVLLGTASLGALVVLPFAEPISRAVLDQSEPGLIRIAIAGLWLLTLYEYLVTLFRLDERAKAYLGFSVAHTLLAIALTVALVVFDDRQAEGILLGAYLSALPFVAWLLWSERRRLFAGLDRDLLRRMLRFGLPTMPAELSLYSLQFIDRLIIARSLGLVEVGLYAIAFKCSQAIQVVIRGFQLAFPPLAYSIVDDAEARRVYATIITAFVAFCAWLVIGMWLEARWIVDLLASPEYFEAYRVVGLLALGSALYGIYLALVVVIGRSGRTEFNLPATGVGMAVNVGLNLWLVPEYGIEGAGIALVASYLVVVAMMFRYGDRLFPVPWQWRKLILIAVVATALTVGGELALPSDGIDGFLLRALAWAAFPALLWFGSLADAEEKTALRQLADIGELRRRVAASRAEEDERGGAVTHEVELRDEDRLG